MGKLGKKTGKNRQDRYYRLAKEQGYRARSAFKLIQLNKKYDFLGKSKVLIDLCAAPGGWLQVAEKYMPPSSIIVGVDLVPIKPLRNVITLVDDITTEKCRQDLRQTLKTWKADVVLHDGSPNMGTAWAQDAYTQADLTLKSLKLAVEFLVPGGLFISKVFRSKDYNSLLWVFNQLFKSVEVTKPSSSRNQSAEIYVICQGFLAPKRIDPKLLDPKHVFSEVDESMEEGTSNNNLDIYNPEKHRRSRSGYEDDSTLLFKVGKASEFIKTDNAAQFLATYNKIDFTGDVLSERIHEMDITTEEIIEACADLKLLSRADFRTLIKWRQKVAKKLEVEEKKLAKETELEGIDNEENKEGTDGEEDEDEKLDSVVDSLRSKELAEKKRQRKKIAKERAKLRERQRLNMDVSHDITDVYTQEDLFALRPLKKNPELTKKLEEQDVDELLSDGEGYEDMEVSSEDEIYIHDDDEEDDTDLSDLDAPDRGYHYALEEELEDSYKEYLLRKDPKHKLLQKKAEITKKFVPDVSYDVLSEKPKSKKSTADDEDDDEDDKKSSPKGLSKKAERWFSQGIFGEIEGLDLSTNSSSNSNSDSSIMKKRKRDADDDSDEENVADDLFDDVDEDDDGKDDDEIREADIERDLEGDDDDDDGEDDEDDEGESTVSDADANDNVNNMEVDAQETTNRKRGPLTLEKLALAKKLVGSNKTKSQAIDDAYNRYTFNDENLPKWFIDDEEKHRRINLDITKEDVLEYRERMRAIDARPIKKVAEAKARKKRRMLKKVERVKQQANSIIESEEAGSNASKMKAIEELYRKKLKKKRDEVKLVVAKGGNRGVQGRPKGVKGRYKMVDSRMKKDLRSMAKVAGKTGKKKSGKGRKGR